MTDIDTLEAKLSKSTRKPVIDLPDLKASSNSEWELIENSPFHEFLNVFDSMIAQLRKHKSENC
jgi:hypothetical protein